jgi:signal transduction histidine kinase
MTAWRPHLRILALSIVVGLVTGTFSWFGARLLLGPPLRPGPTSTYGWYLYSTIAFWAAWGLVAPLALGVADRYRFVPSQRRRAIVAHIAAGFAIVCVQTVIAVSLRLAAAPLFGVDIASTYRFATVTLLTDFDWNYSVYLGIVGTSHAIFFHEQSRARAVRASQLEARLAEAQLQALQRQLHPHFLFNTLHAVHTLVRMDPVAAEQMIERLSELLRVTLKSTATQEVSLAEELAYLDRYLAIEKVHFGDRLIVEIDVPLGLRDASVPNLVLQPLVENAVRHGLAPHREPGRLRVTARRDGDDLVLSVSDTGRGVATHGLVPIAEGVGLTNTRQRLERLYGDRQEVRFEPAAEGGLTVTLRLPFMSAPAMRDNGVAVA